MPNYEKGRGGAAQLPSYESITHVLLTGRGDVAENIAAIRLVTDDGITLAGVHRPGPSRTLAVVVAHGFTGSVERPAMRRIVRRLGLHAGVVAFDCRGHGRSAGASTVGDAEVLDLDAAVRAARQLGYQRVASLGFSLGGAVAIRHAACHGGVDAVVSVSAASRWFVRDTAAMRRVHWLCETALGRGAAPWLRGTRLVRSWDAVPPSPVEVVAGIAPTPLLVVHGDRDAYFSLDHPRALAAAAGDGAELWIIEGMGHAESAMTPVTVDAIARWLAERTGRR